MTKGPILTNHQAPSSDRVSVSPLNVHITPMAVSGGWWVLVSYSRRTLAKCKVTEVDWKEVQEIKELLSKLMVATSSRSDRTASSSSSSTTAGAAKGLNKFFGIFPKEI